MAPRPAALPHLHPYPQGTTDGGRSGLLRPEGVCPWLPYAAAGHSSLLAVIVHVCTAVSSLVCDICVCVCVFAGVFTAVCTHQDVSGRSAAPTRPVLGPVIGQPRAPPCSLSQDPGALGGAQCSVTPV